MYSYQKKKKKKRFIFDVAVRWRKLAVGVKTNSKTKNFQVLLWFDAFFLDVSMDTAQNLRKLPGLENYKWYKALICVKNLQNNNVPTSI